MMQSPTPPRSNRLRLRVPPQLSQPKIQYPASTQAVTAKTAPMTNAKPRPKLPPPIFLRKGANFFQISADCTRLRINYSKAVRTTDDGIKIHCPDVETFRGLKTNISTEEAKNIFNNLNRVCGLSGIRVGAPHKKGGPGQCHRCQLYGHAAANCHADPRCVKCLVPHWTRECPRTRESGKKPSCVNCLRQHTANYRGCSKAPKFISHNRPNPNRPKSRPVALPRDLNNFPDLAGNKPTLRLPPLAPPPTRGVNQSLRCHRGPLRDRPERLSAASHPCRPPLSRPRAPHRLETASKRSILRAVKSSEISEFARDFRACNNVEEKLIVLVKYNHLMVKLESI
ncbi:Nucleic-acid-binding protein from transposon X-element [Eumeta japonica]|uniref:Nucleic-acid-binding protein from transposon X-element n=1 Tax=Eumeta variegata TaxID=151549 RepID=A0A4C1UUS8_EUMVA|nr:Nucleic-acid-binding protein from transposon X-element [Eumeta japonica]